MVLWFWSTRPHLFKMALYNTVTLYVCTDCYIARTTQICKYSIVNLTVSISIWLHTLTVCVLLESVEISRLFDCPDHLSICLDILPRDNLSQSFNILLKCLNCQSACLVYCLLVCLSRQYIFRCINILSGCIDCLTKILFSLDHLFQCLNIYSTYVDSFSSCLDILPA